MDKQNEVIFRKREHAKTEQVVGRDYGLRKKSARDIESCRLVPYSSRLVHEKKTPLADRMKLLLSNGDGADIQFLVLKAHKNIMIAASDVFEAMIRFDAQNAKAKTSSSSAELLESVEITDIDANVFKVMLSFIYAEDSSGLTGDNLIAVLYAANKYHISLLAKACADFPLENELPNVFLAYEQTQLLDEKDFSIRCLDYIDRKAETLFGSEEFLQISQNSLSKIFGSDQLKISGEIALWNTALRWADEKCRQNAIECSPKNRRSALGPALFKIRFPLITMETFAKEIVPSGVLTVEEVLGIYQFHCHPNLHQCLLLHPLQFSAQNRATCRQLVMDIEQLSAFAEENEGSKRYSETVYRKGVPWNIMAKITTRKSSTAKCLGFYLLNIASKEDPNWSCKCSATLRIVSQKSGTEDSTKQISYFVCNNKSTNRGFPFYTSFAELMDPSKGLYDEAGDKITLAIEFTVEEA
ncbi:hypothetical protein niasHT_030337 [Heterodera trifolii]|uniref:BTB domain-containing protein n=1 Tax=Heterodera trifolii TaxID=157864 RepID=A0ABD2KRP4_9BILA